MLGKIKSIKEICGTEIPTIAPLHGEGGRLGVMQMFNNIFGKGNMDGYEVETDKHVFWVLIDNEQSCCESWGYMASEDNLENFIGAELKEVSLTDVALNEQMVEASNYYEGDDGGGIQFVNFFTNKGMFQLAVYNAHNGYYGHGILVAKDKKIILNETL